VREASQGRAWPVEITSKGDDKYLVVATIPAQGGNPAAEVRQALVGGRGWVKNPGGVRELRPNELADVRRGALDLAAIKIQEPFPRMTVTGRERVGGREAVVLEAKASPGATSRYYFDAQSGLLLRVLTLRETVLHAIPEQIDFEDYREVDGVRLPFTVRVSNIDTYFSSTRRFSEIRHNVDVDDSVFAQPPAAPRPTP
jgi:zinc protease